MNKYNKPWKVIYSETWDTNEIVVSDKGVKIVEEIIDCIGNQVVRTDLGVYHLDQETAEYLVKCVNEREDD